MLISGLIGPIKEDAIISYITLVVKGLVRKAPTKTG